MNPRARIVAASAGLAVYTLLAAGSFGAAPPTIITMSRIVSAANTVNSLLEFAQSLASRTTGELDVAYSDLGTLLRSQNIDVDAITRMESTHARLRGRADSLRFVLAQTEQSAEAYFDLLEQRTEQNGTEEFREEMLDIVREQRERFDGRMANAGAAMARVDASVKKYDDILGYLQVRMAPDVVDRYIADVDRIAVEAEALDRELQAAIGEGLEIIRTSSPATGEG